jgi:hypothetical protein
MGNEAESRHALQQAAKAGQFLERHAVDYCHHEDEHPQDRILNDHMRAKTSSKREKYLQFEGQTFKFFDEMGDGVQLLQQQEILRQSQHRCKGRSEWKSRSGTRGFAAYMLRIVSMTFNRIVSTFDLRK